MLQHETGLPVSQDRQLCRNAARARQQACAGALGWVLGVGRAGVRQALGVRGRAGWRCRQLGLREQGAAAGGSARQAGRAAAARRARGRAGNGRQASGQARRGRAGVRSWAHGARGARSAWAWPGRWMGAQAGPALVHCAPGSVLARFLDPVRLEIFLSHQMNTIHLGIFFAKKKNLKFN